MDHALEVELLDELLGLRKAGSAYLDAKVEKSPVERYTDPVRFTAEIEKVFKPAPALVAHASEIGGEGDFVTRELVGGLPVLLTRDREGTAHAFVNVCRHRGARLVLAESGCRHRFTCPYHAWTYDNRGSLIAVPHREQGFPDMDLSEYGLKSLPVVEAGGWIWVRPDGGDIPEDAGLGDLTADFETLGMPDLMVFAADERDWAVNWKILAEGGLEAYHFRVAHAKTIAPIFHDNLSTYREIGPHIRSILARKSLDDLVEKPTAEWDIRSAANILYTLFPNSALLAIEDHLAQITFVPQAVDRTRIRVATLAPKPEGEMTDKARVHWEKNHALTLQTLEEDFRLGEQIQAGLAHGANDNLTFGRYEGALEAFNRTVESAMS